jgi:diadenosine tetraphosphate (Ap4A) HIT family hydrolase
MSLWNDIPRWTALISGAACPICQRGEPLDVVTTLDASWLTMQRDAPMVGYACVVSRIHAVELHDLSDTSACAFMRDARRVSRALCDITGVVKLNYEIHGNTLPHLHMHFFPRYRGDAFENRPIDPRSVVQPVYADGQFESLRARLLQTLSAQREANVSE